MSQKLLQVMSSGTRLLLIIQVEVYSTVRLLILQLFTKKIVQPLKPSPMQRLLLHRPMYPWTRRKLLMISGILVLMVVGINKIPL